MVYWSPLQAIGVCLSAFLNWIPKGGRAVALQLINWKGVGEICILSWPCYRRARRCRVKPPLNPAALLPSVEEVEVTTPASKGSGFAEFIPRHRGPQYITRHHPGRFCIPDSLCGLWLAARQCCGLTVSEGLVCPKSEPVENSVFTSLHSWYLFGYYFCWPKSIFPNSSLGPSSVSVCEADEREGLALWAASPNKTLRKAA